MSAFSNSVLRFAVAVVRTFKKGRESRITVARLVEIMQLVLTKTRKSWLRPIIRSKSCEQLTPEQIETLLRELTNQ